MTIRSSRRASSALIVDKHWKDTYNVFNCSFGSAEGGKSYAVFQCGHASLLAVRSAREIDARQGRDEPMRYLLARNDELCRFIAGSGGARSGSTFVGLCLCGGAAGGKDNITVLPVHVEEGEED